MNGFDPIVGSNPKLLILGSMPSQRSLEQHQYYAHPRNAFWPIIEALFGVPCSQEYAQRAAQLADKKVAVWDVLKSCEREGSLDSAIVRGSEQPNDLPSFLATHQSITHIAFNGLAAATLYRRHFNENSAKQFKVSAAQIQRVCLLQLTSSSPANARLRLNDKIAQWRSELEKSPLPINEGND